MSGNKGVSDLGKTHMITQRHTTPSWARRGSRGSLEQKYLVLMVSVCVCVCACMGMCKGYLYACMCVHACMGVCMGCLYACIGVRMCVYACVVYMYLHRHVCAWVCACSGVCVHGFVWGGEVGEGSRQTVPGGGRLSQFNSKTRS